MDSVAVVFQADDGSSRYGEVLEDMGDRLVVALLEAPRLHSKTYAHSLVRTSETLHLPPELVQDKLKLYGLWNYLTSDQPSLYLSSEPEVSCVCGLSLEPSKDLVGCFVCHKIYHEACKVRCQECGGDLSAFISLGGAKRLKASEAKAVKTSPLPDKKQLSSLINASKYPILTPESLRSLEAKLSRVQQNFVNLKVRGDEKVRQQIRDKLTAALLIGQEEQISLHSPVDIAEHEVVKTAMEIEAFMYIANKNHITSTGYKNKARALQFNLTDPNNPDFRANVLRRTISPSRLVEMDSKDMASSAMKQLRQAREQKYFEEQILYQTSGAKLMVKTHKGEAVIEMNEATVKETSSDLLETVTLKLQVEEDPFDPDAYEPKTSLPKQVDNEIATMTKDWLPGAVLTKLKDRLNHYFGAAQAHELVGRLHEG
jgi:hypothetical protein